MKYGMVFVGALSIEPSRMASMIPRVSRIEIRLPVPFQPCSPSMPCAYLFHLLNQFFSILRRVQREESCTEASRECRGRFCDATFRTGQLSGKAGQEVILSLLAVQDRYRRQYTEGVSRQEDYLMSVRTFGNRLNDVVDVVDRIRYAGVLRNALVCKVNLAGCVYGYVLQQSVALDGVVDIGFAFLSRLITLA